MAPHADIRGCRSGIVFLSHILRWSSTHGQRTTYEQTRNPDTVLRDDDEEDTLYSDGLEVDDDAAPLGTPRGDEKAR